MRKLVLISLALSLSCNVTFAVKMTLAADEQKLDFSAKKSKADLAYYTDDIKGAIDQYKSLIDSKDTSALDKIRYLRIAKFNDKKHFLKYLEKLEKQFEEG